MTPSVGDPVEQRGAGGPVGEVGGEHVGGAAGGGDLVGERRELVRGPGHQGDPWPRRARSRAISAPMPEEAPVTTAVRSGAGAGRAMPGEH